MDPIGGAINAQDEDGKIRIHKTKKKEWEQEEEEEEQKMTTEPRHEWTA